MRDLEFARLVREVVGTDEYQRMKTCRHHVRSNAYDHSLRVAWLCYRHCKRFGTDVDVREVVRGALLHDFYLYDRKTKAARRRHGRIHPSRALTNARRIYRDLSETERDIILHHMFPLTLPPPRTRGGRLVCFYDKIAAVCDYCVGGRKEKQ